MRIMTIHGAKGLEFPIVVMASLGGTGSSQKGPVPREAEGRLHFYVGSKRGGSHFPTPGYEEGWEEEREALDLEDIRLLYVAATRARDHLVIPDFRGKRGPGRCSRRSTRCCLRERGTSRRSTAYGCSTHLRSNGLRQSRSSAAR